MNYLGIVIAFLYAQLVFATPCNSAFHNNFDFWLGDWQVFKPDGSLAGTNSVSKDYNNCVLRDGKMELVGDTLDATGQLQHHRIRWTPNPDGSVRQHWQTKTINGDWATIFDGLYKKTNNINH